MKQLRGILDPRILEVSLFHVWLAALGARLLGLNSRADTPLTWGLEVGSLVNRR